MLLGYLGAMAAIGAWFARRNTNTEEYFVGGRSFPGWAIGLSLVGTSISSVTFLAYPADAFKTAWLRYIPNFALPVAVLIAAYAFLPFFRRTKTTSAYEYLERRFGPSVRVYAGSVYIIAQLVRTSIILYLVSLVIHEMTGLSPTLCILVGGIFTAFYTVAGGIDAVIWTDVAQTIMLVLGGVLCLAVIVTKLPGGFAQIFDVAIPAQKFAFSELKDGALQPVSWGLSLQKKTVMMMFFVGMTNWLREYSSGQHTIQRYAAAKSTHEARKAMWICVGSSLPIWAFYMFLGTALYVFFQAFPAQEATEVLEGTRKAEQILPFFIVHYLPPGITGLVIAAALAAAMSSLDSSINSISTIAVTDIYRRFWARNKPDRHHLRVAQGVACVVSVLMIGGAIVLANTETKTLQDTGTILVSVLGGGLVGLYLLGFFTNRGDTRAVWWGLACTLLFTAWTILSKKELLPPALCAPFDLYYTAIIGNLLMFIVGFGVSLIVKRGTRSLRNLTVWQTDE
jgi:solute:Na+ symporter, SSS family